MTAGLVKEIRNALNIYFDNDLEVKPEDKMNLDLSRSRRCLIRGFFAYCLLDSILNL